MPEAKEPKSQNSIRRPSLPEKPSSDTQVGGSSPQNPYRSNPTGSVTGDPSGYIPNLQSSSKDNQGQYKTVPNAPSDIDRSPYDNAEENEENEDYDPRVSSRFRFGGGSQVQSRRARIAKASLDKASDLTAKALASRAYYWLFGLLIPTFGLTLIGLNFLLIIPSIRRGLKLWQKLSILALDALLIFAIALFMIIILYYLCSDLVPDILKPLVNWAFETCEVINEVVDNPGSADSGQGQVKGDFYLQEFSPRGKQ